MANQHDPIRPPRGEEVAGPGGGLPPPAIAPPPPPRPRADERSIGDLLGELANETTTLLKQELALAKVEIRQEVRIAARNSAYVAAGGAVAYAGAIVLLIGLGWLIGQLLGATLIWLGLLLVGAIVAGAGYALVQKGLSTLQDMDATPERTAETLKENKQWLKDEINH
jgi:hypothetical protein